MNLNKERDHTADLNNERTIDAAAADHDQGLMAQKLIALANKSGVPVHEDRNLIEILSTIDLTEDVPTELYKAVAEVLAFTCIISKRL
jgi:type III secretion system FlhB-like substrate exporter